MGTVIVEQEQSEDTKGVIRSCRSKKDTYHWMFRMAFFKV